MLDLVYFCAAFNQIKCLTKMCHKATCYQTQGQFKEDLCHSAKSVLCISVSSPLSSLIDLLEQLL